MRIASCHNEYVRRNVLFAVDAQFIRIMKHENAFELLYTFPFKILSVIIPLINPGHDAVLTSSKNTYIESKTPIHWQFLLFCSAWLNLLLTVIVGTTLFSWVCFFEQKSHQAIILSASCWTSSKNFWMLAGVNAA